MDDERCKALSNYQKDGYWHFWIGDEHLKIPKPFEVGAIFGTVPERLAELAVEQRGMHFLKRMKWVFGEMFRLDIVPQLLKPPLRIYSNWDEFRERPVLPEWLQRGQAEDQYDERTPLVAIATGRAFSASPAHVQTLVEGYLGAMGTYIMAAADRMLRALGDYPSAPSMDLSDAIVLRRFMGQKVPRSTVYLEEFYEMKKEVDDFYNSIQINIQRGEVARARHLLDKSKSKLALRDWINKQAKQLSKLNKVIRAIRADRHLSSEEKKTRVDALQKAKNELARVAAKVIRAHERKG